MVVVAMVVVIDSGGGGGSVGDGGGETPMVCNATCMAVATSCLSKVMGIVAGGGGVGEVVGWRGLRQYDSESGIPVGQYHGGRTV